MYITRNTKVGRPEGAKPISTNPLDLRSEVQYSNIFGKDKIKIAANNRSSSIFLCHGFDSQRDRSLFFFKGWR